MLREIRLAAGLTQRELAKRANIYPEVISRIETKKARCGELIARRLGEQLFCDWRVLIT